MAVEDEFMRHYAFTAQRAQREFEQEMAAKRRKHTHVEGGRKGGKTEALVWERMSQVPLQRGQMLIETPSGHQHILDRKDWAVV